VWHPQSFVDKFNQDVGVERLTQVIGPTSIVGAANNICDLRAGHEHDWDVRMAALVSDTVAQFDPTFTVNVHIANDQIEGQVRSRFHSRDVVRSAVAFVPLHIQNSGDSRQHYRIGVDDQDDW